MSFISYCTHALRFYCRKIDCCSMFHLPPFRYNIVLPLPLQILYSVGKQGCKNCPGNKKRASVVTSLSSSTTTTTPSYHHSATRTTHFIIMVKRTRTYAATASILHALLLSLALFSDRKASCFHRPLNKLRKNVCTIVVLHAFAEKLSSLCFLDAYMNVCMLSCNKLERKVAYYLLPLLSCVHDDDTRACLLQATHTLVLFSVARSREAMELGVVVNQG